MTDWRTEQRTVLAGGATRIGGLRLGDGEFIGDADEAVQLRVELFDARQQGACQLFGRKALLREVAGNLGERQVVHGGVLHHSITRGTRYRPSSTAGAMAW